MESNGNFEDDEDFFELEESETDALIRINNEKIKAEREKYLRNLVKFEYFKGAEGIRRKYLFYNADNIKSIDEMMVIFLASEEYEKCTIIRKWQKEIATQRNKVTTKKQPEISITF